MADMLMNINHPGVSARFCAPDDPGHPNEYIVHVDGAGSSRYIGEVFSRRIAAELDGTGFDVSNRGTRIEIIRFDGPHRDDVSVAAAISAAASSLEVDGIGLLR